MLHPHLHLQFAFSVLTLPMSSPSQIGHCYLPIAKPALGDPLRMQELRVCLLLGISLSLILARAGRNEGFA